MKENYVLNTIGIQTAAVITAYPRVLAFWAQNPTTRGGGIQKLGNGRKGGCPGRKRRVSFACGEKIGQIKSRWKSSRLPESRVERRLPVRSTTTESEQRELDEKREF